MSLLFADGFDGHISLADRWFDIESEITISTNAGKYGTGTNALDINPSALTRDIRTTLPVNPTNTIGNTLNPIHFAFFIKFVGAAITSDTSLLLFKNPDTLAGSRININTSGQINVSNWISNISEGSNPSYPASGTSTNLYDNQWHHVEVKFAVDNSAGIIKIWMDGVLEVNFTGDNLLNGTNTLDGVSSISISGVGARQTLIDDLIIWDEEGSEFAVTGQYGIHRLETLIPNAAGSSTGFTVTGAASNYLAVDEAGADYNTTYVESGTSTTKDLYNYTNLSGTPDVIAGVIVTSIATNPDAAAISIKHKIKSGATEVAEATHQLSASGTWSSISDFVHQDPNTTAAWTTTNLNAAEFGMEVA